MKPSENTSDEETGSAPEWSTTSTSFSELFGEHQQTLVTVGIFAAVVLAFLGICLPLFIL